MSESLTYAPAQTLTKEDIKAQRASKAKLPSMKQVRERFREHYIPAEDRVLVPLRDEQGNRTKAGKDYEDMFAPFARAEAARSRARAALMPQPVLMRDESGSARFVPPHLVRQTAIRNGWRERPSRGGFHVEHGPDGMLFRCVSGAWEATGVRCLGQPLRGPRQVPRRGIQHDPDGHPWRWVAGKWRMVG